MDTVPFTARRSTDKPRQPAPLRTDAENELIRADAASPEVVLLADIWKKILRVEEIRSADNFFELGGNSLHAMLLASRILRATGFELSLAAFFDEPTFGSLRNAVSAGLAARQASASAT